VRGSEIKFIFAYDKNSNAAAHKWSGAYTKDMYICIYMYIYSGGVWCRVSGVGGGGEGAPPLRKLGYSNWYFRVSEICNLLDEGIDPST
jgi:hypothetical protein